MKDFIDALEADNLVERIAHRKTAAAENKNPQKGQKENKQHHHAQLKPIASPNPKIGFKYTHYSVNESAGFVELTIIKKVAEEFSFYIKTRDGAAKTPEDYETYQ